MHDSFKAKALKDARLQATCNRVRRSRLMILLEIPKDANFCDPFDGKPIQRWLDYYHDTL